MPSSTRWSSNTTGRKADRLLDIRGQREINFWNSIANADAIAAEAS
jgi:hypothetical protein